MGRKSRTAVLKRQREVRKAEKAAMKREKRVSRDSEETGGQQVATSEDLAGYGFNDDESTEDDDRDPPPRAPRGPARHRRSARGVDPRDRPQHVQPDPSVSGGRLG